jgi:hypothetical protein
VYQVFIFKKTCLISPAFLGSCVVKGFFNFKVHSEGERVVYNCFSISQATLDRMGDKIWTFALFYTPHSQYTWYVGVYLKKSICRNPINESRPRVACFGANMFLGCSWDGLMLHTRKKTISKYQKLWNTAEHLRI